MCYNGFAFHPIASSPTLLALPGAPPVGLLNPGHDDAAIKVQKGVICDSYSILVYICGSPLSVEKFPHNRMLGTREIVNGKPGKYIWMTYKEVYDRVVKVGKSIRSCGIEEGGRCGIFGANCAEWIMSMEACNTQGLYCIPLYDTLGAGAVEFIICHAEVAIAFVEEKKISELLKTFPVATKYLKTLVSFGKVAPQQKEGIEKFGVAGYSWDEFLSIGENKHFDLPVKKKTDICTIMYTSGTTGDPKGVMISNNNIVTMITGVKRLLGSVNESVSIANLLLL